MTQRITRRTALKLGGAFAAPLFLPARFRAFGSPNETLRIGCIGVGRMGRGDMFSILDRGLDAKINARIVAVCDPDGHRASAAKADVEKRYADKLNEGAKATVDVYRDFRELLAREDIDAVTISTPDFWHGGHGIAAARAKKDIYIQKPITYSIGEGKKLVQAVRENGVILQTGSQQRSDARWRKGCELVRNGRLGKLQRVIVWLPPDKGRAAPTDVAKPAWFDYDLWMGPTATRPYAELGVHPLEGYGRPGWLQRQGYTLGMITGWGSHMNDIAQWGHGSELSGIADVEAKAEYPDRGLFDVHTNFRAVAHWADGVELIQETNPQAGVRFIGTEGEIFMRRGSIEASKEEILQETIGENETHLYVSNDHYRNFLECARSRKEPICPVEVGHRSNSVCVVTHIAMKLERKLRWDPVTETFSGDDEANAMLDFERRDPWKL